jgi:hypothetical protein
MKKKKKHIKYNINKYRFSEEKDSNSLHNYIVCLSINKILKQEKIPLLKSFFIIEFMTELDDIPALTHTVKSLFKEFNLIGLINDFFNIYDLSTEIKYPCTEKEKNRMISIYCANRIKFKLFENYTSKKFSFVIKDKVVKVPYVNFHKIFSKNTILSLADFYKNNETEFNKLTGTLSKADYDTNLYEKHIVFLERQRDGILRLESKELNTNPYPRIFVDFNAFNIFDKFRKRIEERDQLADFSFLYRIMLKDELIYESIGDSEFRRWLTKAFQIEIDETKQLYLCETKNKKDLYTTIKQQMK